MFPNVAWRGARGGRIARVEMEPKGSWDAGPTPRDTEPSLWFLCIASGRMHRCIRVWIHSAVLLSTYCTPGPGTGKYPESIWGGGLPGTGPSDSTGEVWKTSVPVLTKRHVLSESREGGHLGPLPGAQALLFCSMGGPAEADLAGRAVQGRSPSRRQLGPIAPPPAPTPTPGDLCPRQEKPTALIRPSWGWMVHSGLCYFQIVHVAPVGMLHKRRRIVTSWKLKNLCPHLHAFSLSVILQVKITVARIHMPLSTRIEKVLQRFLRLNHSKCRSKLKIKWNS